MAKFGTNASGAIWWPKIATNASGAIWWPNLELMQVAGAGEITQVKRVNTLGPLCLWQCFFQSYIQNIINSQIYP